jgi:site-specific DNA-methyltransferase (adenine-specific)
MKNIKNSSVDMVLCDLPYGTTNCKWDSIIPFEALWEQYERIAKPNAAFVLTATQHFAISLAMSNFKNFKYQIVWAKNRCVGFLDSKKRPLRQHEVILVFYKKQPIYNPVKLEINKKVSIGNVKIRKKEYASTLYSSQSYDTSYVEDSLRYPTDIVFCDHDKEIYNSKKANKERHPTQKPLALFEYLIQTYSNEGDLVLDNCLGSGTTAVACQNLNRRCIGIEKDDKYFEMAQDRVLKNIKLNYTL